MTIKRKKLVTVGCTTALLLILTCMYQYLANHRNVNPTHYDHMLAFHVRQDLNMPKGMIYFIGDSHIQGLATQSISPGSVNYGVGSDTTAGVLRRVSMYWSLKNAKAVVIGIGFNDLKKRQNPEITVNIKKIISALPNDIPILISDIFPINRNSSIYSPKIVARIENLNENLHTYCDGNKNIHCIKVYDMLSEKPQRLYQGYDIGDGVHLNSTGYKIWISAIKHTLIGALPNEKSF